MKSFFQEFRKFINKGNVMNMAVGVIIGAALQGVVKSLTDDILSPIIGLFNGQNFDSMQLNVMQATEAHPGVTIRYGAFMTNLINFLITAFVIFMITKSLNKLADIANLNEKPAPKTKKCPYCISDISIEATRCPNCTSVLAEEAALQQNEDDKSDL